jgi:hypothetical protein
MIGLELDRKAASAEAWLGAGRVGWWLFFLPDPHLPLQYFSESMACSSN